MRWTKGLLLLLRLIRELVSQETAAAYPSHCTCDVVLFLLL